MNDIGDGSHIGDLSDKLSILSDHRVERTRRHSLTNIMVIAICAVVCGADYWVDIEEFGKAKREWLSRFLDLSNAIPSHDTFDTSSSPDCDVHSTIRSVRSIPTPARHAIHSSSTDHSPVPPADDSPIVATDPGPNSAQPAL